MRNNNDEESGDTLAGLLEDFQSLVAKAERLARATGDELSAGSSETVRAQLDEVQACLGELYSETKREAARGALRVRESIYASPYRALALAVGAGLVVGVLAGNRAAAESKPKVDG